MSKKIFLFRPIWIIILSISLVSMGFLSFELAYYSMDIQTFLNSFRTPQITAQELQNLSPQERILIDVRTPEEYAEDHLPDSHLVPITDIELGLGAKEIQKIAAQAPQATVVLYCGKGPRSIRAYHELTKTGIEFVVLKGGIQSWRKVVPKEEVPMT